MSAEPALVHSARDIAAMRRALDSFRELPRELAALFAEPPWLVEDLVVVALEQGGAFDCLMRPGERFSPLVARAGWYVRHAPYEVRAGWRGHWVVDSDVMRAFGTERGRAER